MTTAHPETGGTTYRVLRELGSRVQHTYSALREPHELVVVQRFIRTPTHGGPARTDVTAVTAEAMALLLRDARCLAKNWHPNVARVRHVDLLGTELFIATEMVDGVTLGDLLQAAAALRTNVRDPVLPLPVLVRILVDVLGGLHGLHGVRDAMNASLDVIHGELCPTNIVVGKDGVARLVAVFRPRPVKVGASSEALGYASPEALDAGGTDDVRADIYAVGVILWEALTGRRLWGERDPARIRARQREEELVRPELPESSPFARLADVAMRALSFDPALRPKTASEVATELRRIAGTRIAPGSVVAQKVQELAGDRIRARRHELGPRRTGDSLAPPPEYSWDDLPAGDDLPTEEQGLMRVAMLGPAAALDAARAAEPSAKAAESPPRPRDSSEAPAESPKAAPKPAESSPKAMPKPAESSPKAAPKPAESSPKPAESSPKAVPKPAESSPKAVPKPAESSPRDSSPSKRPAPPKNAPARPAPRPSSETSNAMEAPPTEPAAFVPFVAVAKSAARKAPVEKALSPSTDPPAAGAGVSPFALAPSVAPPSAAPTAEAPVVPPPPPFLLAPSLAPTHAPDAPPVEIGARPSLPVEEPAVVDRASPTPQGAESLEPSYLDASPRAAVAEVPRPPSSGGPTPPEAEVLAVVVPRRRNLVPIVGAVVGAATLLLIGGLVAIGRSHDAPPKTAEPTATAEPMATATAPATAATTPTASAAAATPTASEPTPAASASPATDTEAAAPSTTERAPAPTTAPSPTPTQARPSQPAVPPRPASPVPQRPPPAKKKTFEPQGI